MCNPFGFVPDNSMNYVGLSRIFHSQHGSKLTQINNCKKLLKISLLMKNERKKQRKMSNIAMHPTLPQQLCGARGIQGTCSLVEWIILSCREVCKMKELFLNKGVSGNIQKYSKFLQSGVCARQSMPWCLRGLTEPLLQQE